MPDSLRVHQFGTCRYYGDPRPLQDLDLDVTACKQRADINRTKEMVFRNNQLRSYDVLTDRPHMLIRSNRRVYFDKLSRAVDILYHDDRIESFWHWIAGIHRHCLGPDCKQAWRLLRGGKSFGKPYGITVHGSRMVKWRRISGKDRCCSDSSKR